VAHYTADIATVWGLLNPQAATAEQRRDSFDKLAAAYVDDSDPVYQHMGRTMQSFAPGLFAGGDDPELPQDNQPFQGHSHVGPSAPYRTLSHPFLVCTQFALFDGSGFRHERDMILAKVFERFVEPILFTLHLATSRKPLRTKRNCRDGCTMANWLRVKRSASRC